MRSSATSSEGTLAGYYWEVVLQAAAPAVQKALRWTLDLSNFKPKTEFGKKWHKGIMDGIAKGEAKGEAKGTARAVLRVLARQGLTPTAAQRRRIEACQDLAQLDVWLDAALDAQSVREALARKIKP
jgi:hypothetical protein